MAAHFDLSVIAIVGIILLIGIVKKNGIMLVDFAQQVEQSEGLPAEQSIYQACVLPLSADLDDHDGGAARCRADDAGYGGRFEIRQPLGYGIVGGLAVSQVLTLYTTPVVYIYFDRLQSWMMRGRKKRPPYGQAEPQLADLT